MNLSRLPLFVILLGAVSALYAQPTIQAALNAASYTPTLAPGGLTSIFGTQLATGAAVGASSVPLPLQLNGVSVAVNGIACPLNYVSPGQVNLVIPFEVANITGSQRILAPIVVTTPAGSSAAFYVSLARNAPGLFTQNGAGTGSALVFDANLNQATSIGTGPIILYATGLGPTDPAGSSASGGSASPPLNQVVDAVTVMVGDTPGQVLFAGLAPGLPGVYQINVVPNGPISNRLAIIVNQQQSNIATLPIPVGTNVTNVSASISGLFPIPPPTFNLDYSEILFAAKLTLSFDLQPGAKPFQVIARCSGGADTLQEIINIDPVAVVYTASAPSPTVAERTGNFSMLGHPVIDFLTGNPFPGNIIPASRLYPQALQAEAAIPSPNASTPMGDNLSWAGNGNLPNASHFDVGEILQGSAAAFGGFTSIQQQNGGSLTAKFELFVDGLLAASQSYAFPVD